MVLTSLEQGTEKIVNGDHCSKSFEKVPLQVTKDCVIHPGMVNMVDVTLSSTDIRPDCEQCSSENTAFLVEEVPPANRRAPIEIVPGVISNLTEISLLATSSGSKKT